MLSTRNSSSPLRNFLRQLFTLVSVKMDNDKRFRNRNFSDSEIRVLIEEVSVEGSWLFAKNTPSATNKKKDNKWKEIAGKVSACGVSKRKWVDVKEKFKKMKNNVLKRQDSVKLTGGGKPLPPVPYEELIAQVIGEGSNLVHGIAGVDLPDQPLMGANGDCGEKLTLNNTPFSGGDDMNDENSPWNSSPPVHQCPEVMRDAYRELLIQDASGALISVSVATEDQAQSTLPSSHPVTLPTGNQRQCLVKEETTCSAMTVRPTVSLPTGSQPLSTSAWLNVPSTSSVNTRKQLGRIRKERLQTATRSRYQSNQPAHEDPGTWNTYLESEIKKNEASVTLMTAQAKYYLAMTQKIRIEMDDTVALANE